MATQDDGTSEAPATSQDKFVEFLARAVMVAVFAGAVASAFVPQQFFVDHWKLIAAVVVVAASVVFSWRPLRNRIRNNVRTKVGAIVVSLAGLSIVVGLVGILPARYQVPALRSVFVLTACLFPSVLYYLFITTRKDSLCTEFFTNLERLGLLARGRAHSATVPGIDAPESEDGFRLRLLTYVQKFEAAYGPLDQGLVDDILDKTSSDPRTAFVSPKGGDQRRRSAAIFSPEAAAPLFICTVLIALGWIISLPPWQQQFSLPTAEGTAAATRVSWEWALYPDASPVYYAFIGAYFFGIQMLFRRYVLKDLRTSAYVSLTLRILLAVIGVWVLLPAAAALGQDIRNDNTRMLVIAFAIGFFPPVVWQFIQAVFKKITFASVVLPSVESQMPLSELDGLTIWHEARLQEEDIENVPNMATASLVDLMLNTRFSPDRIVDWVDQAILYTHLGLEALDAKPAENRRGLLRTYGIRGASALLATYEWTNGADRAAFEKILPGDGLSPIRTLVQTVVTNPNVAMILAWRQLSVSSDDPVTSLGPYSSLGVLPPGIARPR